MATMMTEIQRNDLLGEWLDIVRKATISNPQKEKSIFRREFEHSKLNTQGDKKRKYLQATRRRSHPHSSIPGYAADASPDSSGIEDVHETEEEDDTSELLKIYQRLNSMESMLERLVQTSICDKFVPFNKSLFQQTAMS